MDPLVGRAVQLEPQPCVDEQLLTRVSFFIVCCGLFIGQSRLKVYVASQKICHTSKEGVKFGRGPEVDAVFVPERNVLKFI